MGKPWNTLNVQRRLRDIVDAVPGYNIGGSTQSTALPGICSYAVDMAVVQRVTREVMKGLCAPTPDREWGDDGYREEMRKQTLDALDWAEKWVEWRSASGWSSDHTKRCLYGSCPWEKAT